MIALLAISTSVEAATISERLLSFAQRGTPPSAEDVRREIGSLYSQMGVPEWMRRNKEMAQWDVKLVPSGTNLPSFSNETLLVNGSISLKSANFAVIIATGDVDIGSGAGLVVIAGGNIRFNHNPGQDWSGVFVSRRKVVAPWVGNIVVHASGGLELENHSTGVIAIDTVVRSKSPADIEFRSGERFFSDSSPQRFSAKTVKQGTELSFAGKRCSKGPSMREIAEKVPAIARQKAQCKGDLQLVIASCAKEGPANGEELWTVHLCRNVIVDVSAKQVGGGYEIAFKPGPPSPIASVRIGPPPISAQPEATSGPAPALPPWMRPSISSDQNAVARSQQVDPLFQEAYKLQAAGKPADAAVVFRKILEVEPTSWQAHINLAGILSRNGDSDGALRHFDRAIELSEYGGAYGQRGMLRLSRGEAAAALADMDKSVALEHDGEESLNNRGLARLFTGNPAGAVEDFTRIIEKTPLRPNALRFRGWARLIQGRYADACEDANRSLETVKLSKWPPSANRANVVSNALVLSHVGCAMASDAPRADSLYREWRDDLRSQEWPDAFVLHLHVGGDEGGLRQVAKSPYQVAELNAFLALKALQAGQTGLASTRFAAARASSNGYTLVTALSDARWKITPKSDR